MKRQVITIIIFLTMIPDFKAAAQKDSIQVQQSITELRKKVEDLEWKLQNEHNATSDINRNVQNYAPAGLVLFFCGCFCALWAQNSRRNPWLWFFFGLFLSGIALITLLIRNRDDHLV